jgi:FixJ family two-component response regulator
VDDDKAVLKAMSRLLRSDGLEVRSFTTPADFLAAYDPGAAGCLVLDLTMPGMTGLELQRLLQERGSAPPVVFLTGTGDIPASVKAMRQGAADFLTKPAEDEALLSAVRSALDRERAERRDRLELINLRCRLRELTPREREVMDLVVTGRLNKQIAAELGIAEKTVKVHRARVMEKMRVESVAELVQIVQRLGAPLRAAEPAATNAWSELDQRPMDAPRPHQLDMRRGAGAAHNVYPIAPRV